MEPNDRNGSSKHLTVPSEANNVHDRDFDTQQGQMLATEPNDGNGSNGKQHSRTTLTPEVNNVPDADLLNHGNEICKDSNITLEVSSEPNEVLLSHGNESCKDSNIISKVNNVPDADLLNHGNESGKDSNVIPEVNHQEDDNDDVLKPTEKQPGSFAFSASSISSSSSCSSLDEDFQLQDERNDDDTVVSPKLDGDTLGSHSHKSESFGLSSPGLASPPDASSCIPQPSLHDTSPNQSPPLQVMQRAEEPNPYRIPSTVFARSPSTSPVEWSVTSNESLFSIHMGNNSFSGDQIFLMGRSEELGMPGDYNNFLDTPPKPMEPKTAPTYSTAAAAPSHKKSFDMRTSIGVAEAAAETMKDVIRATAEDHDQTRMPPSEAVRHSSSYSRRSDESGASVVSFAFPILTGDGGRTVSAKVDPEPQHVQMGEEQEQRHENGEHPPPSSPAPLSAPTQKKWFQCFTCCSFCR